MIPCVRSLRVAIPLLALWTFPGAACAQWTPEGVTLVSRPGSMVVIGAATDLNRGAYVAWEDHGAGLPDGRFQHVLADGTADPRYPAGGLAFCEGPWTRYATSFISDDMGGAYVAWLDDRSPPPDSARVYAVYMSRVGYGGAVPGWPATGTPLCTGPCTDERADLTHDMAGGVFASWTEFGGSGTRVMHMDADGGRTQGWPIDGVAMAGQHRGTAPDGQGGAFVSTTRALYHVTSIGSTVPGWPAAGITAAPGATFGGSLVADDSGGVYCVWSRITAQGDSSDGVYARRIRFDGSNAAAWPDSGLRLSRIPATVPMTVFWAAGGAVVVWGSFQDDENRVLAQRVEPGGVASGWPADGVELGRFAVTTEPRGISDGAGGAFVVWDHRDFSGAASLQHVLENGRIAIGWPSEGVPLPGDQGFSTTPFLAAFEGPEIVAWANPMPSARETVVRAARIPDLAPTIDWVRPLGAVPRAHGVRVQWFLRARTATDLIIERQDRLGWIPVGTARAQWGVVGFTDTEVRPGSIYRYRLSVQVAGSSVSFAEMAVTVPLPALQVRAAPANPARGALEVEIRLPHTTPAVLEVFDARGRRVDRREIAGGAPRTEQVRLGAARRLASGVYYLRVSQGDERASKRVVLLR